MTPPVTQTFNPAIGEYGQDYAVKVGTPIYSPIAGIVATEDNGKQAWGKRLFVHAQSGLSFAVGHLTAFAAHAGQRVQVGQLIGYSGGATSDPSSGKSTGPHVEVQFLNQAGHYLDPSSLGSQLEHFVGTIFRGAANVTGGATSAADSGLSAVTEPIAAAISSATSAATRAFWLVLAVVLAVIGTMLIISGELGKGLSDALDKADEVADKVAPAAAKVAPEAAEVAA